VSKGKSKTVSVICIDTPENLGIGTDIKKEEKDTGMIDIFDYLEIDEGSKNITPVKNITIDIDEITNRLDDIWRYMNVEIALIDISRISKKKKMREYKKVADKSYRVLEVLSNYLKEGKLPGEVKWY
jgi:hypothetical protein